MSFKILHLNIERDRHLESVFRLLEKEKPDLVCLEEARYTDIEKICLKLNYNLAFAPLFIIKQKSFKEKQGSAILSKFPILEIKSYKYNDNPSQNILTFTEAEIASKNGKRPENRFSYNYTLLTIAVRTELGKKITIATTHFPVVDHNTPGLPDHELAKFKDIDELEHSDIYLKRLLSRIRALAKPLIFTADLNNARGEYVYDSLAHELRDIVPKYVDSTLDPKLHRKSGLKLVVDTIMLSPNILLKDFRIIEGVSDHKALIASLEV